MIVYMRTITVNNTFDPALMSVGHFPVIAASDLFNYKIILSVLTVLIYQTSQPISI